jgi:ubiquinone/menaquinone biosynthesis C-methylase UbiE
MHVRDFDGVETAAIASAVDLAGTRVLEVGCGEGRLTRVAAAHASYVYAFDPKPEAIATAEQALAAASGVRFAVHDAEALDVGRERFDLALCGWSL